MQDLAFEFSKIFPEWYPRTLTAPHRVGTQTLASLKFSAVVAPLQCIHKH